MQTIILSGKTKCLTLSEIKQCALLTRTSDMLISLKRSDPDVLNAVYVSVNKIQPICISIASKRLTV